MSNFKGASECSKNGGSGDDIAVVCNRQHTVLTYSEALLDRIVSYRIPYGCIVPSLLNNPGLQGTPATRPPDGHLAGRPRPSPRRSASIQAPAAVTVLIGRTTVLQCCALLPACLCEALSDRIVSYRIVSRYFV